MNSKISLELSPIQNGLTARIPALLLVGGMGTRLRPVLSSKPKPLAPLGESSFLELLILQLRAQGFRRILMCTGFMAEQIEQGFGNGSKWGVEIEYSRETEALGTAGAIKLGEPYLANAPEFIVMNGDSFLELDFQRFVHFHREHGGEASIAVRRVPDAARYGTVGVAPDRRIVSFQEKTGIRDSGLINGGVYIFKSAILAAIPAKPTSLEKDILPALLEKGVFAFQQNGIFIDIGTPEDYARAQTLVDSLTRAARLK